MLGNDSGSGTSGASTPCSRPRPPARCDTSADGQQHVALHDVDPAVGEAALVAQPHDVELEVLAPGRRRR